MLNSPSSVAAKAATAPLPAALPATVAPRTGTGVGNSFAQMLDQQAPATPPAPPPAAPAPAHAEASRPPASADAAPKPPAPAKPATSNGTNKPAGQAQGKAKSDAPADTKQAAAPADGQAVKDDDDAQPDTAVLDEFTSLIGLAGSPADAAAAAQAAEAAKNAPIKAPPGEDDWDPNQTHATGQANVDHTTDARTGHHAGDAGQAQAAEAAKARAGDLLGSHDKALQGTAALQDAARSTDATSATPRVPHPADAPLPTSFAASLQTAMTAAAPAAAATGTSSSTSIGAPLHSPTFAPEVAASVSLMAVDGVQHAELQLNPSEMGPVSVQIVLDGAQAQVSFHAAQAETRQALEKSLPDLAAALQGQGLTLSGGGVFQQSPQQRNARESGERGTRDGGGSRTSSRLGGGTERIGATAAAAVRRQVGLVDTFA